MPLVLPLSTDELPGRDLNSPSGTPSCTANTQSTAFLQKRTECYLPASLLWLIIVFVHQAVAIGPFRASCMCLHSATLNSNEVSYGIFHEQQWRFSSNNREQYFIMWVYLFWSKTPSSGDLDPILNRLNIVASTPYLLKISVNINLTHKHTHTYESCPKSIQPFWISREPVACPWCNLAASQRRPYCASVNSHSPVGLVSRQWDAVDWACVLCDGRIHKSHPFQRRF
jgi:hypothetical protein